MSIIEGIRSGDAEVTGGRIEPTNTLVDQTHEAVERMRAEGTDDEQMFGSIRVTRADTARARDVWAAWKAGDATIYLDLEIDRRTYLLFSTNES